MSFPRKPVKVKTNQDIELLCLDWIECDETIYQEKQFNDNQNNNQDELEVEDPHNKFYCIFLFGVTTEGHSVCVKIKNYHPYFYLKIPDDWSNHKGFTKKFIKKSIKSFDPDLTLPKNHYHPKKEEKLYRNLENIREKITQHKNRASLIVDEVNIEKSEIFWSFTNNQKYKFIKLAFQSKEGFRLYQDYYKHNKYFPTKHPVDKTTPIELKLLNLILNLCSVFHDKDIKPSDWIRIPKK